VTRILNEATSYCPNWSAIIGIDSYIIVILAIMGEAKRRKDSLGEKYGQEANIYPWLPISKSQAEKFVNWSTRGSWIGIGLLVASWIIVRFIGPVLGLWQVN